MDIHFKHIPATYHHIPRTGGTSFTEWVEKNFIDYEIAPMMEFVPQNKFKTPNYDWVKTVWPELGIRFTFVRNPYSRLVSLYYYVGELVQKRLLLYKNNLSSNIKTQPFESNNRFTSIIDDTKMLNVFNKGFDHWIHTMLDNPIELYENTNEGSHHLIHAYWGGDTQISWFCDQMPDIVIKMEEFNRDFVKIQNLLNCNKELPHVNSTEHNFYRTYYTKSAINLVEKFYKDDLEGFGYEF
jgi:hypothetical protein